MTIFKNNGSVLELDEIIVVFEQWVVCPLLSPVEISIVQHLLEAARSSYGELEEAITFVGENFTIEVITAVNKARHMGIGQYAAKS